MPGQIHRSDRMAETGLFDDGRKGIRRLTDPDLRIRDQDRDGVQAEVLYGILGASSRIGLVPEACMTFYLPRIVGLARAAEILYTGRQVSAEEAMSMGLVNQVAEPEDLDLAVNTMVRTLADAAPIAIQLTRRELYRGLEGTFGGQLEMELFHQKFAGRSLDAREGPRAFMEKRKPDFQGR